MGDEEDHINQGYGKSFKQAPEDQIDAEGSGQEEPSFPARLNIIVEKPGR